MSKLKDKLSANMRMVKANQQSAAPAKAQAPAKPAVQAAQRPAARPAASSSAAKPAPARSETARSTTPKGFAGGSIMFPARVWPD